MSLHVPISKGSVGVLTGMSVRIWNVQTKLEKLEKISFVIPIVYFSNIEDYVCSEKIILN
jgi:hypothetical protein